MQTITSLGLSEARELLAHIIDVASSDGLKPVAICIVDATGRQLVAACMDGAKNPSIATALAKAVTAIAFERDTKAFRDGWAEHDVVNAMKINPTFCSWAGGVLVRHPDDNSILGAIGVSNRDEDEDHELASHRPWNWMA